MFIFMIQGLTTCDSTRDFTLLIEKRIYFNGARVLIIYVVLLL